MYSDPKNIRNNPVKVRFSEKEEALIDAFVAYNGGQKAALIRELVMSQITKVLNDSEILEVRKSPHCGA